MSNIEDDIADVYHALHAALDEVNGELCHLGQYVQSLAERITKIELSVAPLQRAVFARPNDYPKGHASMQTQLDELYDLITKKDRDYGTY